MSRSPLERVFGQAASLAFVVGTVVGTGIYLKPSLLASLVAKPSHLFLLWALGGLFAGCGAAVYSALAQNWPESGGAYIYLRETYGSWAASVLLAADVFLGRPAAVGALATGMGLVWSLDRGPTLLLALSLIVILTGLQLGGSRLQGRSQVVMTVLQCLPLLTILGVGFLSPVSHVSVPVPVQTSTQWAAAFLAILWAYDGWYNITLMAGEVEEPTKTFPVALVGGLGLVTLLYLLLNWVLLRHLSFELIQSSPVPFAALFEKWSLPWLGTALRIALSIALLATLNGTLACGSRVLVAASQDGLIPCSLGPNPTDRAPTLCFALWCFGFLLLFGGLPLRLHLFDSLTELTALIVVLLTCLTVTCVFHGKNFAQSVSWVFKICALIYIALNVGLAYFVVREGNLLALAGGVGVFGLGTAVWFNKRGRSSR